MSSIELSATLARVARLPFAPVSALTQETSLRRLRGIIRLVVVLSSALALSGVVERANAQTTYTCSTATPSANCAMTIPGGNGDTTTNPAQVSSSTMTVSGATGPVASVQVVLQGVTTSTAKWEPSNPNNQNAYQSLCYSAFFLQDPNGDKLSLLGETGSCVDPMSNVSITIQDGATVAPPDNVAGFGGAWPSSGSTTVEPSSYWDTFNPPPLYDSSPGDLPQTDGSATLSKFNGATANGTWTLILADSDQTVDNPRYLTDPVQISGWQLILTYSVLPGTTTTVTSSVNPSYTASSNNSTTLTATVSGTGGTPRAR